MVSLVLPYFFQSYSILGTYSVYQLYIENTLRIYLSFLEYTGMHPQDLSLILTSGANLGSYQWQIPGFHFLWKSDCMKI